MCVCEIERHREREREKERDRKKGRERERRERGRERKKGTSSAVRTEATSRRVQEDMPLRICCISPIYVYIYMYLYIFIYSNKTNIYICVYYKFHLQGGNGVITFADVTQALRKLLHNTYIYT
jgi:hypothetical protein